MHRFRLLGVYVAGTLAVVGLAVAVISVRRAETEAATPQGPEDGTEASAADGAPAATVQIEDFGFSPKEIVVAAGATVTWVNTGDVPHTATGQTTPPLFDSHVLRTKDQFSFEFKTPGTFDYFCKVHPAMTGSVIVK